jgi:hypothetical protein
MGTRGSRGDLALAPVDATEPRARGARGDLVGDLARRAIAALRVGVPPALDKCQGKERSRNEAIARADADLLRCASRSREAREVGESWDRVRAEIAAHPERATDPILADLRAAGWSIPAGGVADLERWPRSLLLAVRDILVDEEIGGTPAEEFYLRQGVVGFRLGR